MSDTRDTDEMATGILDLIGDARVQFWTCPVEHPRLPLRVTVEWSGNVATCTDCGRTSRCLVCNSTDQTRVPERFRTHGPFCNDNWHRSGQPSLSASRPQEDDHDG